MAIIYSYPEQSPIDSGDLFVVSSAADNKTKSFSTGALLTWIDNNLQYDLQQVLNAGNVAQYDVGSWDTFTLLQSKSPYQIMFEVDGDTTTGNPNGKTTINNLLEIGDDYSTGGPTSGFSQIKSKTGNDLHIAAPQSILRLLGPNGTDMEGDGPLNVSHGGVDVTSAGNVKIKTLSGVQTFEGVLGPNNTAFEFKSSALTNPAYFHLKDTLNLYIQSRVTDSLGDVGTDGKVLKSDANGFVKWADDQVNLPGGSVNAIQFHNSSGEFDGDNAFLYEKTAATASKVTLGISANHAGDLHIHSDGDNSIQAAINMFDTAGVAATIKAPLVYSTDYALTLPEDEPQSAISYLVSNASGEMSWSTAGGGASGNNGSVQLSNGSGAFIHSVDLEYDDSTNTFNVGLQNNTNVPAPGVVIGASSGKSGTLSILGPTGGKVQLTAASTGNATVNLAFPDAVPTANQILESDANGQLSWIDTPTGNASGTLGLIQFADNSNGFDSDATLKYDSNKHLFVGLATNLNADSHAITIGASESKNGKLEIFSKDNHKLVLAPATTTTTDLQLKFPANAPTLGQVLQSDASGNLSWTANSATAAAAGSTGDVQINNGSNQMAAANPGSTFNWIANKGSLALSSVAGSNAALAAVSDNNTSTQSFTANLGVANFENKCVGGTGTAQYTTVMALKSDNATQATGNNQEFITFYNNIVNQPLGSIIYDGNTSSMAFVSTSDERLKKDKEDYDKADAGSKIKALKVKKYKFIDGNDKEVKGFFAQQVKDVIPEAVIGEETDKWDDGSDKPLRINHVALIPYLTAALQEAQDTIEQLETKIEKFTKEVEELGVAVSTADDKADKAIEEAGTAKTIASAAEDQATDASGKAQSAFDEATKANDAAEKAQEEATEAKTTAAAAKQKADTNETEIAKKADKEEGGEE